MFEDRPDLDVNHSEPRFPEATAFVMAYAAGKGPGDVEFDAAVADIVESDATNPRLPMWLVMADFLIFLWTFGDITDTTDLVDLLRRYQEMQREGRPDE